MPVEHGLEGSGITLVDQRHEVLIGGGPKLGLGVTTRSSQHGRLGFS
jgi:hypothetical protein